MEEVSFTVHFRMKRFASLLALSAALVLGGAGCFASTDTTVTTNTPAPAPAPEKPLYKAQGHAVIAITDAATKASGVTAVAVTVDKVEIHSSTSGWMTVSTAAKTYDLVQLKNASVTKVLADATVAAGTYDQIRLDISKVEVTASGTVKIAKLPSNTLKIVGNFTVAADQTSTAVLDFNLDKSLHMTGTGLFILAPVVRLQTMENADVSESTDASVTINGGKTETDETVGEDQNGEVKENFTLPVKLDLDATGHIKVME